MAVFRAQGRVGSAPGLLAGQPPRVLLILCYALLRRPVEYVLIVGNVPGIVVYFRNVVLLRREVKRLRVEELEK